MKKLAPRTNPKPVPALSLSSTRGGLAPATPPPKLPGDGTPLPA